MPEGLVNQQDNGCVLLVVKNHSVPSSYLKAVQYVGSVTPVDNASVHDVTTTESAAEIAELSSKHPPVRGLGSEALLLQP